MVIVNAFKQRAIVVTYFGGVEVCVAPPENRKAAIAAAVRIINKKGGGNVSFSDIENAEIIWGEVLTTKGYERQRNKRRPFPLSLGDMTPPRRCPHCDRPDYENPCWECGYEEGFN